MEDTTALADAGAPPGAAAPPPLDHLIETWWADHFPGSPVAQVTQAWNHAFAAKEELKRRLADSWPLHGHLAGDSESQSARSAQ